MSTNHSWSLVDGGKIIMQGGKKNKFLLGPQIAEHMNKMQDVIDAVEKAIIDTRHTIPICIVEAYDGFKPKTTEQLLAERLEAADNLATTSAYCGDAVRHDAAITYEAAKAAHEASLL